MMVKSLYVFADVAKLADALDLGSSSRKGVEVQVLSSAPITYGELPKCEWGLSGAYAGSCGASFHPPELRGLFLPLPEVLLQLYTSTAEVPFVHDVVPIEHASSLVTANLHGDLVLDSRALHVANGAAGASHGKAAPADRPAGTLRANP